jgi:hypothetical protein
VAEVRGQWLETAHETTVLTACMMREWCSAEPAFRR